jgi:hypothetical protein
MYEVVSKAKGRGVGLRGPDGRVEEALRFVACELRKGGARHCMLRHNTAMPSRN